MHESSKIASYFIKLFLLAVLSIFLVVGVIGAQTPEEKLKALNDEIEKYEQEIGRLQSQANTLTNQIAQYDAQIRLTTLKISETEAKISQLAGRIDLIEASLEALTQAFSNRVEATYKMKRLGEPFFLLLTSSNLSEIVSSFHYLKRIQEADRELLIRLEETQSNYEEEKVEQEDLQVQLEEQKKSLDSQKEAKAVLLEVTRNDEKRYQDLLAKALEEFKAIQAIIAGKGEETEVGLVSEGQKIATVIVGSSACSSGGHLHFEVVKGGAHNNPANFLQNKTVQWDNSPDGHFSFSGSWRWPINEPIRITQGYGMTYYAAQLKYYGGSPHTGIDMINNNDYSVLSVKNGTLYRGSINCGGGKLRYVRVKQDDGYDTYYLHINYI